MTVASDPNRSGAEPGRQRSRNKRVPTRIVIKYHVHEVPDQAKDYRVSGANGLDYADRDNGGGHVAYVEDGERYKAKSGVLVDAALDVLEPQVGARVSKEAEGQPVHVLVGTSYGTTAATARGLLFYGFIFAYSDVLKVHLL